MKKYLLILSTLSMSCVSLQSQTMEANAVSMTKTLPAKCSAGKVHIKETWCEGETFYAGNANKFGYFDEVIAKAQKIHKADYLLNAVLKAGDLDGKKCATIEALLPSKCEK